MNLDTSHGDLPRRLKAAAEFYRPDAAKLTISLGKVAETLEVDIERVAQLTVSVDCSLIVGRMRAPYRARGSDLLIPYLQTAYERGGVFPRLKQCALSVVESPSAQDLALQYRYLQAVMRQVASHHGFPADVTLPGFREEFERMVFSWLESGWPET